VKSRDKKEGGTFSKPIKIVTVLDYNFITKNYLGFGEKVLNN